MKSDTCSNPCEMFKPLQVNTLSAVVKMYLFRAIVALVFQIVFCHATDIKSNCPDGPANSVVTNDLEPQSLTGAKNYKVGNALSCQRICENARSRGDSYVEPQCYSASYQPDTSNCAANLVDSSIKNKSFRAKLNDKQKKKDSRYYEKLCVPGKLYKERKLSPVPVIVEPQHVLAGHAFKSVAEVKNLHDCITQCYMTPTCSSGMYWYDAGLIETCVLNTVTRLTAKHSDAEGSMGENLYRLVEDEDVDYFELNLTKSVLVQQSQMHLKQAPRKPKKYKKSAKCNKKTTIEFKY